MGGHSKGGNLAIYAAVNCKESIQKRILEVYNNDGPGFNQDVITSPNYIAMLKRIRTIVPQGSIIGMLLEREEEYTVVKSKQVGLMQHDAMSWEVLGTRFVYSEEISKTSQMLDHVLKEWVGSLDEKERLEFVEALYSIFETTGAKTISELTKAKLKKANMLLKSYNAMDDVTKEMIGRTIKLLTNTYYRAMKDSLGKKTNKLKQESIE